MKTTIILEQIEKYDLNQLIMTDLLYDQVNRLKEIDKKTFNVYLARLAKQGHVERLQRGVYYRAKSTKLGKTKPNLFKETILIHTNNYSGFFGYETFLNKLGLNNSMPKKLTIYSMNPKRNKYVDRNIRVKKINYKLNRNNIDYIELITLLKDVCKHQFHHDQLYPMLAKHMLKREMKFDKLIDYMEESDKKVFSHIIRLKKAYNNLQ